jgi:hypothetical protein
VLHLFFGVFLFSFFVLTVFFMLFFSIQVPSNVFLNAAVVSLEILRMNDPASELDNPPLARLVQLKFGSQARSQVNHSDFVFCLKAS